VGAAAVAGLALGLGLVFAGSPNHLAEGTRIAGVDVGGLPPQDALALLERRAERLAAVPVTFVSGTRRWRIRPEQLGVSVDWAAAVHAAERQGGGFGPVRGYRRLELRFFEANLDPPIRVYDAALTYEIRKMAVAVDSPHREARLVRRGLTISTVAAQTGRVLDRVAAADVIVRALAGFDRAPVGLPVGIDPPTVTAADLLPARRAARVAISAPVTLKLGETRWRLPRWRIALMLDLPERAGQQLAFHGKEANRYFSRLAQTVDRSPRNADWAVYADGIELLPSRPGHTLDVPRTARAILAATSRRTSRTAPLVVSTRQPKLTTAEARAMQITGRVGSYETFYGGDANRIHNVQLVSHLVDRTLIAPGAIFSFNSTTGERTAAKGFREAPVIINGELQTGLGGGVCQVSTTVFNAAYEAGLPITARTNHALYISHYPQGRDATVNYPDLDLKFVNDTGHWLLLRTFVGPSSLVAALFGTPAHRRVESDVGPIREVAPPPVERVPDASMLVGQTVVDDNGEPARSTWVTRRVYSAAGKLLSKATWYSSYRGEPEVVRYGTLAPPKPKPKPKPAKPKPATTTPTETVPATTNQTPTTPTETTGAETTPTETTPVQVLPPVTPTATETTQGPRPPRG
jgi:vancomycin resistance protein YoaR